MSQNNFFLISHRFESNIGNQLSPAEKYFIIMLIKLENRFALKMGDWFWHKDKGFVENETGERLGFENYGFSKSSCVRIRKKLVNLGFIQTTYQPGFSAYRTGIEYRIVYKRLLVGVDGWVQNEPLPWARDGTNSAPTEFPF